MTSAAGAPQAPLVRHVVTGRLICYKNVDGRSAVNDPCHALSPAHTRLGVDSHTGVT